MNATVAKCVDVSASAASFVVGVADQLAQDAAMAYVVVKHTTKDYVRNAEIEYARRQLAKAAK